MNRTIRTVEDLAEHLRETDWGTARPGDRPCPCHHWGRVDVQDCGGEQTAFRTCTACGELQDVNLTLLADAILNELSGVAI